ncbi:MAG: AraC family transcriptional regulator [Pseudomonadales bacterium]|nr:AraC family transcriptional regulator [Pseudomonadales bacterium]
MNIGDVASDYLKQLLDTAASLGADRSVLLKRIGIEEEALTDPSVRFDLTQLMKLGYVAIEMTGDPSLGLRFGASSTVMRIGYSGLTAMSSPNLGAALDILIEFEALTTRSYRGSSSYIASEEGAAIASFYSIAPYNNYTLFIVDIVLSGWYNLVKWLTGKEDLVEEVHFEFDTPEYQPLYQDYFNCPVLFGQSSNSLILAKSALQIPVIYYNPHMHQSLRTLCEQQLREIFRKETFGDKVQKIIGPVLHTKTPTIETTAETLGIPTWTLRRKLKEENLSFQALVDNMRKDLALGYMRDTELSFGEIAYTLGFSTPGAFQRAFKRWTNSTPGEYRRSKLL